MGLKRLSTLDVQQEHQHQVLGGSKISTLDVRPEKHHNKDSEAAENKAIHDVNNVRSPMSSNGEVTSQPKASRSSFSVAQSPKSAIYSNGEASNSFSDQESLSSVSDFDIYEETSRTSTVIHIQSSDKSPSTVDTKVSRKASVRHGVRFSDSDNNCVATKISYNRSSSSVSMNSNLNDDGPAKQTTNGVQMIVPDTSSEDLRMPFPPKSIVLPETKEQPRRTNLYSVTKKNKSTQASFDSPTDSPRILTTLDLPIKTSKSPSNGTSNSGPKHVSKTYKDVAVGPKTDVEVPPLVVNFDSEHSSDNEDSDYVMKDFNGGISDKRRDYDSAADSSSPSFSSSSSSSATLLNNSTSIYFTDDDTSSIYSDIYSVLTTEPDSLVYVYRSPPRHRGHTRHQVTNSTVRYRFPAYILTG